MQEMWVNKFEPTSIDDLILSKETKDMIKAQFERKTINNLLLIGKPGIGKTSLANIIQSTLGFPFIYVNAAYEGGVDTIRGKVKNFCDTSTLDGAMKLVIIDEGDSLSGGGGENDKNNSTAQGALRTVMDQAKRDTRFIMTANYGNKITDALKSRFTSMDIGFSFSDVMGRVMHIMKSEGIKYDKDSLTSFIVKVARPSFPDIRGTIKELENWCSTGTLMEREQGINTDDATKELIDFIVECKDHVEIRKKLIASEHLFNRNYISMAQRLFNRIGTTKGMMIVAEHLYRMHIVSDPEIEFTAMMIELKEC